jgi:hypothetical protein
VRSWQRTLRSSTNLTHRRACDNARRRTNVDQVRAGGVLNGMHGPRLIFARPFPSADVRHVGICAPKGIERHRLQGQRDRSPISWRSPASESPCQIGQFIRCPPSRAGRQGSRPAHFFLAVADCGTPLAHRTAAEDWCRGRTDGVARVVRGRPPLWPTLPGRGRHLSALLAVAGRRPH